MRALERLTRGKTGAVVVVLLGGWFLFTGAAKALDPIGFASVIEEYGILTGPDLTWVAAWALIAAEVALGACLVLGIGRRPALVASGALLLVFTAATARAWWSGSVHDCGCFGPLLERTPGQTLVQDLVLLGLVGLAFGAGVPEAARRKEWRAALVCAVATAGLVAPPAVARLSPALAEGLSLERTGVGAHLPWNPPDPALYAFLEPLEQGEASSAIEAMASDGVPVIALSSATAEQIESFRWSAGPSYEIVTVPRRLIRRLSQDRRGAFLVQDGNVRSIWRDRMPAPAAVAAAGRSSSAARGIHQTQEVVE